MNFLLKSYLKFARRIKIYRAKFHDLASKMPLYSLTLFSFVPKRIQNKLNLSFPSEYSIDLISQGHIVVLKCSGRSIFIRDISKIFRTKSLSEAEKSELHTFGWISILNLNVDKQWRLLIRNHIKFWIKNFKNLNGLAWRVPIVAERIYNWIMQYNLISKTSDQEFSAIFAESIAQQLKFLKRRLYLPLDLLEKAALIRTITIASVAVDKVRDSTRAINELAVYLEEIDCIKSCKTTQEILKTLRYLIEIQAISSFLKKNIPFEISKNISQLANIVRNIRHSDGGISIFQSEFTPSPLYIDALLSNAKKNSYKETNSSYLRLQSLEGAAFIDLRNKFFPIEFSAGIQRIILGSYVYFPNRRLRFSNDAEMSHSIYNEKNNIWFTGKSSFSISRNDVTFEKKLYVNNLGTDIRCEENMSNESFDVSYCIVLPSEPVITPLEYKNGFFMDFATGARWVWNLSKNAKFLFDFARNGILNGERKIFTLLTIETTSPNKNKLRWSLKRL
ncbi:MAG: hypothetical protein LBS23_00535 [Holosporaceae bacterium]|jgi:hypothetical protein|nr:hypothetical protein [Holosporaceae bacterium]